MHYLYVISCTGGHLYLGVTVDLRERWTAHVSGRGSRFTREHPPERMVYVEPFESLAAAEAAERVLVRDLGALRHPLRIAGGPLTGYEDRGPPTADQVRAARMVAREQGDGSRGQLYALAARTLAVAASG